MSVQITLIERALQIAAGVSTLVHVRDQLVREGFKDVDKELSRYTMRRLLRRTLGRGAGG